MKRIFYAIFSVFCLCISSSINAQTCGVSAVYGGGPFYKTPSVTIPELRSSGFTTAVIWTIHIDTGGNFNYNAEFPIVANGQYIGHNTYPNFRSDVALLKTPPTSIRRIEVGLSAAGGATFQNIKNQIAAHGTGPTTNLYKNFKALKDSIPQIDAVNFDDEVTFDIASSVQFAVMLSGLGYKVALCPYNHATYWTSVASQTNAQAPGTVDAIFLQCYAGGASNSPCSSTWNFGTIPVYPGLWDTNYTPAGVQTKMAAWKTQCNITGGFMWLYDDFKGTVKTAQYAKAIDTVVGIGVPAIASGADPANGAANVSLQKHPSWTAACDAQSYDVYFGTTNPPPFVGNQTTATYIPASLSPSTHYYWRVDAKNYFGTTTGTLWNFTTQWPAGIAQQIAGLSIGNAYPNPFSEETRLELAVPDNIGTSVTVFDFYGRQVCDLKGSGGNGKVVFVWNGRNGQGQDVAAGVYFLRITATDGQGGKIVENRKVVLVK